LQDAASLTDYAVLSRYPGDLEPVDEEEYQEALRLAEAVLAWAEETIHDFRNPPQESENQTEEGCEDESEGQEINGDYHQSNYQ
jgi:hypothetical protein